MVAERLSHRCRGRSQFFCRARFARVVVSLTRARGYRITTDLPADPAETARTERRRKADQDRLARFQNARERTMGRDTTALEQMVRDRRLCQPPSPPRAPTRAAPGGDPSSGAGTSCEDGLTLVASDTLAAFGCLPVARQIVRCCASFKHEGSLKIWDLLNLSLRVVGRLRNGRRSSRRNVPGATPLEPT